jgi:hypothetical protein
MHTRTLSYSRTSLALYLTALGAIGWLALLPYTAYAATPIVESAKVTSPNTVAIVYSEAVNTTLNDYGSFTGSLSSASLSTISGSGTNVITLTFSGTPFAGNASGGLTIGSTVTSVSDGSTLGGGPYSVVDGQPPLISSFSLTSNLAGGTVARAGDTISFTFNADEPLNNASATVDGNSVSLGGSGSGPYTGSYTISSSDTQDTVPVSVTMTDVAGNQGNGSFALGGGSTFGPHISSITSDAESAGVLGAGGTINFTLTLASPAQNAYVNGSYDGRPLTWTTGNGGATYNAAFTLQASDPSTSVPLQISGVTVRDASGNTSAPAAGTDVQKTLNPQSFVISQVMAVGSPVQSGTPARFGFYTPQDGSIVYGGSCTGSVLSAVQGDNYVSFNALSDGVYSNCTIEVQDGVGYSSNVLSIPTFTVGAGGAVNPASSAAPVPPPAPNQNTAYAYKFYNPLNVGSSGADVTALQERLAAEGLFSGSVTGYYGALTRAAVQAFQRLHGLAQLGNVGPGTRSLLNSGI